MVALMGSEACSETIVIRSNAEWLEYTRTLRYDGQRYERTTRVLADQFQTTEQDAGLFALVGASS